VWLAFEAVPLLDGWLSNFIFGERGTMVEGEGPVILMRKTEGRSLKRDPVF
jgi:hypothetical protein